jgi:hypothetical protein
MMNRVRVQLDSKKNNRGTSVAATSLSQCDRAKRSRSLLIPQGRRKLRGEEPQTDAPHEGVLRPMLTKKSSKRIIVCIIVGIFGAGTALANIRLPRLVGDNMVLQRDSKLSLWGWADPGEKVSIEFHGQRVTTKPDEHGRWSASMGPFAAPPVPI